MGYDITFHPFEREDFTFFIEEVIISNKDVESKIISLSSNKEDQEFIRDNIYSRFPKFVKNIKKGIDEYDKTIGFASASLLGFLHPYWYSRGGSLSRISELNNFKYLFTKISNITSNSTKYIFDKSSNFLFENYSSGCYIPRENIRALIELIEFDRSNNVKEIIGEFNIDSLLSCLHYCKKNNLDLLEASDVFVPGSGECTSLEKHFRAPYLKNINDYTKNQLKAPQHKVSVKIKWQKIFSQNIWSNLVWSTCCLYLLFSYIINEEHKLFIILWFIMSVYFIYKLIREVKNS